MEIKIKNYNYQSSLISSIIFFILGGILYTNPDIFITTISKIVGIILLLTSIIFFIIAFINRNNEYSNTTIKIIRALFILLFAILFLFFSETVEKAIRIVVGFWILFCGINRLITALQFKNKKFLSLIIVSLLLIAVGIYTITIGDVVLTTIGIILMVYSAIDIIGYILYSKDKMPDDVDIDENTKLITSTKKENKQKKFKKIKDINPEEK